MSIRYYLLKLLLILITAFLYATILVGCGGSMNDLEEFDSNGNARDSSMPITCITDTDVETNKECAK